MTREEKLEMIEIALGDSCDWCGCYEGDMDDRFTSNAKNTAEYLLKMFEKWQNEQA